MFKNEKENPDSLTLPREKNLMLTTEIGMRVKFLNTNTKYFT